MTLLFGTDYSQYGQLIVLQWVIMPLFMYFLIDFLNIISLMNKWKQLYVSKYQEQIVLAYIHCKYFQQHKLS